MAKSERLIRLSEHQVARFWRIDYSALSPPERAFVCVWELESEVNNGGFHLYYFNLSGDHAADCPDALRAIGASNASAIVERANALFPGRVPPTDRDTRQAQLFDAIDEDAFEELDGEFFAYPDDLAEFLYAYVSKNRDQIPGAREVGI